MFCSCRISTDKCLAWSLSHSRATCTSTYRSASSLQNGRMQWIGAVDDRLKATTIMIDAVTRRHTSAATSLAACSSQQTNYHTLVSVQPSCTARATWKQYIYIYLCISPVRQHIHNILSIYGNDKKVRPTIFISVKMTEKKDNKFIDTWLVRCSCHHLHVAWTAG